ncbi:hypothetical protein LAZ67_11003513 [Cordylochernes scorpioides]|uniref:Uncharacterized protein n=1 Tax=Cordylochernes scorpioides TaxID=51811 RepID=A0ABY6KZW7_9ARAC|nr:hypothetical protein LAZ67_11003513 [Cordylochernes scorpioides]
MKTHNERKWIRKYVDFEKIEGKERKTCNELARKGTHNERKWIRNNVDVEKIEGKERKNCNELARRGQESYQKVTRKLILTHNERKWIRNNVDFEKIEGKERKNCNELARRGQESYQKRLTRCLKTTEEFLSGTPPIPVEDIEYNREIIEETHSELLVIQSKIRDFMLTSDVSEEELEQDDEKALQYTQRYKRIYKKCLALVEHKITASSPTTSEVSFASSSHHRTVKLPKIELKKFTGKIKDWLGWWAQFNKIHVDPTLEDSDKFQYLVQSMSPGTRASKLVDSYPLTAENYPKVIETLTERFGRLELLQQVYVRDLIRLMIDCSSKQQLKVTSFYDELVTHLRALESLKIEARQMSVFIFPMIEACLSEELMKAWQRSPLHDVKIDANDSTQTRVELIMEFLQKEAAAEQDRALAGSKFGLRSLKQDRNVGRQSHPAKIPTAYGLFAGRAQNCIFCNKDHKNTECLAARDAFPVWIVEKGGYTM